MRSVSTTSEASKKRKKVTATVKYKPSSNTSTGNSSVNLNASSSNTNVFYCGSNCKQVITASEDRIECERCKNKFHLSCASFNSKVYKVLKNNDYLEEVLWKCNSCKQKSNEQNTNSAVLQMINDLKLRIEILERNTVSVKPSRTSEKQLRKMPNPNSVTHQIIVTNDNTEPFSKQTFADKVKDNLCKIPINKIMVAKDGCGIINFPDQMSRDVGLQKLEDSFNVQANNRTHRSLMPKITISDIISDDYSSEETDKLKRAICEKNPTLNDLIEKGKTFDILFIKEDFRRNGYNIAAVKIDPEIYKAIQSLNNQIFVDFSRCRIADRLHVVQCYQCQKFGHMKNQCTHRNPNVQVCRYCSGNHDSKSCEHKGHPSNYRCANCGNNHSTTSSRCKILQNQVQYIASRTKGMELFSKNEVPPYVIFT